MGLKERASELAGREVEVLTTTDGKFIVDYMRFDLAPPPKCDTEDEALAGFIAQREAYLQTEPGQIEARFEAEEKKREEKAVVAPSVT